MKTSRRKAGRIKNTVAPRKSAFARSSIVLSAVAILVSGLSGPLSVVAGVSNPTISITGISDPISGTHNGPPYSFSCETNPLFDPVIVSGSGTGNGKVDQYHVSIDWGDNSPKTIGLGTFNPSSGNNGNNVDFTFTFSAYHDYQSTGNFTIVARLYHRTEQGNDHTDVDSAPVTLCVHVPPPAMGSVIVTKVVSGGTAQISDFTLNVGTTTVTSGIVQDFSEGTYAVSETGGPGGYSAAFSGDCAPGGSLAVVAENVYQCTITNTFIPNQNNPPVLDPIGDKTASEGDAVSFDANATDSDGDPLIFSITGAPAGSSFDNATGQFSWTTGEPDNGVYTVTVGVSDGLASDSETFTITVDEVNVAPVATGASISTHIDTPKIITLVASDSDLPAQTLAFSIVTSSVSGSLSAIIGNQVIYTPNSGFTGSDSFTFKANDGVTDSNVVTINISVDNTAPTLNPIPDQIVTELLALNLSGGSVISATDPDGDTLTYSLASAPAGASINSATGDFIWTPSETDGPGVYPVTVSVSDGHISDSQSFQITVNEANIAPLASSASSTTDEDTPVVIALSASDSDIPAQALTFSIVTPPTHGSLSELAGNTVTYTPDANYNGPDSFEFKANDGAADSNAATVGITVSSVNDSPTIALNGSDPMNLLVGDIFVDPGANASDTEDGILTPSVSGSVNVNATGTYTLVYSAIDLGGLTASTTRAVIVTENPVENTLALCADGIDNDEDGQTDLADPECGTFIPQITVTKIVVNDNGGAKAVSDFPLFVDGISVVSGIAATTTVGTHIVSETGTSTYAAAFGGDCNASGTVALAAGDNKTCTITNDDIQPQLNVIKIVLNNASGTAVPSNFTISVVGSSTSQSSFPGNSSGTLITLNAGDYLVSEASSTGYFSATSTDCVGTIEIGEAKTCTITNSDTAFSPNQPPIITLLGNNPMTLTVGDAFTDPGATSTDPEDGALAVTATGTVDTANAGTYEIEYSATDSGGLTATATRTVVVNNASPPGGGGNDNGAPPGGGGPPNGGGGIGYQEPPFTPPANPPPAGGTPLPPVVPPFFTPFFTPNFAPNISGNEGIAAGAPAGGAQIESSTIPTGEGTVLPPGVSPLLASIGNILSFGTGNNIIAFFLLFLLLLLIAYLIKRNIEREAEAGKPRQQ